MNTNFYVIHKTPKTHFATTASILEQLLITFSTVQITQIKKKNFLEKISNITIHSWIKMAQKEWEQSLTDQMISLKKRMHW